MSRKHKREREEPCFTCGHYHNVAAGEVCSVCGHVPVTVTDRQQPSAIPSPILENFLYLGSYDHVSRHEVLKFVGITHVLNLVPACQELYKNSFTYHTVRETPPPFQECIDFIDSVRGVENGKVLVHCMSGHSKTPSVIAAYLVARQDMSLQQALQHVQQRHEYTQMTQADSERLQHFVSGLPAADENGHA